MYIQTLAISLLQIAIIVLLGYYIAIKRILSRGCFKQLNNLVLTIVTPCMLLNSSNTTFDRVILDNILRCMLISSAIILGSYLLCILIFRKNIEKTRRSVSISMSVFCNAGFIGFPLTISLYGNEGLLYAISYNIVFNLFFFTLGLKLLSSSNEGFNLKKFLNPMTISATASLILFIIPYRMPSEIYYVLNLVGGMSVPLCLLLIGSWMVGVKWKSIFTNKLGYFVCFVRLLLLPTIFILILSIFKIEATLMIKVCILISALPIGTMNVMLSQKYGSDSTFANESLILSMVLCLATLFLVMQIQTIL